MTHDPIEQLMTAARNARLASEERSAIRRILVGVTHMHPPRPRWSPFLTRHVVRSAFAALVLLMGGTTVLAQRSLPGDPLYSLKTEVTERVAVAVAGGENARIQKELDQISRALNEEDIVATQELEREIEGIEDDLDTDQESTDEPTSLQFNDNLDSDLNNMQQELVDVDAAATIELSL